MKILYAILILSVSCFRNAQTQIPVSSIDNVGDSVNSSSLSMVYSIGEVAIAEVKNNTLEYSEGFISAFFNSSTLSIVEVIDNKDSIKIYPNPVTDVFTLDFENSFNFKSYKFSIY